MKESNQLSKEYKGMIEAAAKVAFITAVRRNHDVTLLQVAEMAKTESLDHLTIGEVFFDKVDFGSNLALMPANGKKRKALPAEAADTRTPAARVEYEKCLLELMKAEGKWVSAATLRKQVGGTSLQARKALNRLIEQDLVKFKGQARATKYRARRASKRTA